MANFYNGDDKITYPQLIFNQIKKIQDICGKELRDGTKVIKNLVGEQLVEQEDTRNSYLQSVEILGILLSGWFSKEVQSNFDSFCDLLDMEISDALKDEDFKSNIKVFYDGKEDTKEVEDYFIKLKITNARKMFRILVKLFKDLDFLGGESYGESGGSDEQDNGAIAIDDSEDEE